MFGYIAPNQDELKVRELKAYRAYYCGLCRAVKKNYGESARLTLNYDCAFLAMLLSGAAEGEAEPFYEGHCAYKLFLRKRPIAKYTETLGFAADYEVLLSYYKLRDDWDDEKRLLGAAGSAALYPAFKRAKRRNAALAAVVEDGIHRLRALEAERCAEPDAPADAFASMLREAVSLAPNLKDPDRRAMKSLAYNIGKWVYLADAWDDREKDKKSGAYNPFLAANADRERASFNLRYSLNEAVNAYELIDLKSNRGVLDNIMYVGCPEKTERLLANGN
ncbi:MAG: DUF5685 family protein [Clostridiaceae bacterium]|nr:DUF5685 family protein [Eubacteriales bacterium]